MEGLSLFLDLLTASRKSSHLIFTSEGKMSCPIPLWTALWPFVGSHAQSPPRKLPTLSDGSGGPQPGLPILGSSRFQALCACIHADQQHWLPPSQMRPFCFWVSYCRATGLRETMYRSESDHVLLVLRNLPRMISGSLRALKQLIFPSLVHKSH